MKHLTAVLLCLLLCGCARQISPVPAKAVPEATDLPVMAGLYDPDHPMETAYPGLVRAYPLPLESVQGIRAVGKDLLVLSGQENTSMILFTGESLQEMARLSLDFSLKPDAPSLQIHENGISFFHPLRQETILLDRQLRESRRIRAPEGLVGEPILSAGGDTLYYCTRWSVMAWNLESGIRRTLKELFYENQELAALHQDGNILECRIRDNGTTSRLLLSADLGLEIHTLPEDAVLSIGDSRYCAALPHGYDTLLVFGDTGADPEFLLPEQSWQEQFYLPQDHAAVTFQPSASGSQLNYYELSTGILRSSLTLDAAETPMDIVNCKGHAVYILTDNSAAGCHVLYRWDVLRQKPDPSNVTSWKAAYHPSDNPDLTTLEACRKLAGTIGEKYGIRIRVWEDATAVQPWDYRFQPESLAPVLLKELKLLDKRLALYPQSLLQQTKDHFTGLTLCLVQGITGTGEEGSLSAATGIQFFQDNEAYVVITTGRYSEQALYHELYHVMETHILTESTALDQWEALNPAGFAYGSSQQHADVYLQGQTRAFVDRYSMGAAKEDRARVLENAMLAEKEDIFRSEYMQRKLQALCTGLREAYRLKQYPEALPWEQYLVTPLVPNP